MRPLRLAITSLKGTDWLNVSGFMPFLFLVVKLHPHSKDRAQDESKEQETFDEAGVVFHG